MKTITILISALLLFIFIGEAQSQVKSQNSNLKKSKIDMPVIKKDAGFNADGYCSASGGTEDEFISRVQIGDIDNLSGWTGYFDYTYLSTTIPGNYWAQITITNGPPNYSTDECGIWVDWNQDEGFDDAGRFVLHFGQPNGIDDTDAQNINIYSNEDIVYVQQPMGLTGEIIIYDLMGQEITRKDLSGESLTTIKIVNGTGYYLVKIKSRKSLSRFARCRRRQ